MKIAIVDYGMGNIRSISTTLIHLGIDEVVLSQDYEVLKNADKLILPGVGAFGKAMMQIREKNIDSYLKELVIENKKPILGICLGMQLMGNSSNEDGDNLGLGFVNAEVRKFKTENIKIPHVGFNQIEISNNSKLYNGITQGSDFYFTHSYRMMSESFINQSMCNYGELFVASFEHENIAGVQFHPELSQKNGLRLLKNFIDTF
jgi:glutamine amidotransferase